MICTDTDNYLFKCFINYKERKEKKTKQAYRSSGHPAGLTLKNIRIKTT